jgi:hypothetical protein
VYNFFQGKSLHWFLVFWKCMYACLLLVLKACLHQKELAEALAPLLTLHVWPYDLVFSQSVWQAVFSLLPVQWFFLDCPLGDLMLTHWNVTLLPGKSSFGLSKLRGRVIHKNKGVCLKLSPIIISYKDWGGKLECLPAVPRQGERQIPFLLPKPIRTRQNHEQQKAQRETLMLMAALAPRMDHFPWIKYHLADKKTALEKPVTFSKWHSVADSRVCES